MVSPVPKAKPREIPQRRDIRWRPKFLESLLAAEGNVRKACEQTGILLTTAYLARKDDDDFAQSWDEVRELVDQVRADAIEAAAAERAVNGSKYTKYSPRTGEVIEEGSVPDTPAAALMLKAIRPERFQERKAPEADAGSVIRSFTDLVRALDDERRGRAALQAPAPVPPQLAAPSVEASSLPEGASRPPLIKGVN